MKILLALLSTLTILGGCALYTPAGSVVVDPGGPGGKFCPPGQAKKGNC